MLDAIKRIVAESISVKTQLLGDEARLHTLWEVAQTCIKCYKGEGKILFCGNGGSAADAQHLAAELSGRFYKDRPPLFAEALHVNSSYVTAVGNDYGYEEIYARLVRAMGRRGDVLIGISTSGNSPNILRALEAARAVGMVTVGMTGAGGGKMRALCDYLLDMPSTDTPRIQEAHILAGHILCQLVEEGLFGGRG